MEARMKRLEQAIHIFMWSVLTASVLHQFTKGQPYVLYFNAIDIGIFIICCIVAYPLYSIVRRDMFGGFMPLSRNGLAAFFNVDRQKLNFLQVPRFIGGQAGHDELIVMWSYSFLLYFATLIDVSRQWLLFSTGELASQKFFIMLCIVGVVSFLLAWLFRLPRSKA